MPIGPLDVGEDMTGLWIALAAIVVALVFGGFRALSDGRFRGTHAVKGVDTPAEDVEAEPSVWVQLDGAAGGAELGERATLVQFSSAFCAPCRVTRRVLTEVADVVPGVVHLEIDAEHHLEAVRRLGILRTPTTVVLDAAGHEVARAAGAPRKEQVLAALPVPDLT
jgi:thiol-disulfide isomerase/thioredoxin